MGCFSQTGNAFISMRRGILDKCNIYKHNLLVVPK